MPLPRLPEKRLTRLEQLRLEKEQQAEEVIAAATPKLREDE